MRRLYIKAGLAGLGVALLGLCLFCAFECSLFGYGIVESIRVPMISERDSVLAADQMRRRTDSLEIEGYALIFIKNFLKYGGIVALDGSVLGLACVSLHRWYRRKAL